MKRKPAQVSCIYAGRRFLNKIVVHLFIFGKQEWNFKAIRGCAIGRSYFANVLAKKVTMNRSPDWDNNGHPQDENQCKRWEAADALVAAELAKRKAKSQASRNTKLGPLVDAMLPFVADLDYWQRRSFVEEVVRRAEKKLKSKR